MRIPVTIIQQEPLIEVDMKGLIRENGKHHLTIQQARDMKVDLQKMIDRAEGRA
jgi:hypothetical protein